jgi:hypothetical protein
MSRGIRSGAAKQHAAGGLGGWVSKLYFDVAVHDLSRQLAPVTAHSHCYRFTRVDTLTILRISC